MLNHTATVTSRAWPPGVVAVADGDANVTSDQSRDYRTVPNSAELQQRTLVQLFIIIFSGGISCG